MEETLLGSAQQGLILSVPISNEVAILEMYFVTNVFLQMESVEPVCTKVRVVCQHSRNL